MMLFLVQLFVLSVPSRFGGDLSFLLASSLAKSPSVMQRWVAPSLSAIDSDVSSFLCSRTVQRGWIQILRSESFGPVDCILSPPVFCGPCMLQGSLKDSSSNSSLERSILFHPVLSLASPVDASPAKTLKMKSQILPFINTANFHRGNGKSCVKLGSNKPLALDVMLLRTASNVLNPTKSPAMRSRRTNLTRQYPTLGVFNKWAWPTQSSNVSSPARDRFIPTSFWNIAKLVDKFSSGLASTRILGYRMLMVLLCFPKRKSTSPMYSMSSRMVILPSFATGTSKLFTDAYIVAHLSSCEAYGIVLTISDGRRSTSKSLWQVTNSRFFGCAVKIASTHLSVCLNSLSIHCDETSILYFLAFNSCCKTVKRMMISLLCKILV